MTEGLLLIKCDLSRHNVCKADISLAEGEYRNAKHYIAHEVHIASPQVIFNYSAAVVPSVASVGASVGASEGAVVGASVGGVTGASVGASVGGTTGSTTGALGSVP